MDGSARAGGIVGHPVFPGTIGPPARRIAGLADVEDVIALERLNYARPGERRAR